MARDDWHRNTSWNAEIAAAFEWKLRRARDKSQSLRIQASYLSASHPTVTLGLLDRYFALGEHFDMAQAHVVRAEAMIALENVDGALSAYEAALERERQYPSLQTQAYLNFSCIIVEARIEPLYARALEVLDAHKERLMFPVDRHRAHGARALLLDCLGRKQEARAYATLAMAAARETRSGFRYHQAVGLVRDNSSAFAKRVAALAE